MNWKSLITLAVIVIIVVALAYGSSLSVGLLSDDFYIFENVSKLSAAQFLQESFSPFGDNFFRPTTLWWWWISDRIWGENFSGYHLENVIVHILNSLLVGFLALQIFRSRAAAWVSSILFAVFPLHPEAVTWLAGRFDLFSVMWSLAALILWMEWRYNGGALRYWFVHICMVFAMLSKESVLILPILILGLEWMCHDDFKNRSLRKVWWLPGILLWIGVFTWRWIALSGIGGYQYVKVLLLSRMINLFCNFINVHQPLLFFLSNPHEGFVTLWLLAIMVLVLAILMFLMIVIFKGKWILSLPFFLSPLHENLIAYRLPVMIALALVILIFFMVIVHKGVRWSLWKRLGGIVTGLFITIVPVFPIFQITPDLRGSRLLYFPTVFMMLFIGGVVANIWVISKKWRWVVGGILVIWIAGYIGLSRYNVSFWNEATTKSNQVLESLSHTIKLHPGIKELHVVLGQAHHHGAWVFQNGFRLALKSRIGKREVIIEYLDNLNRLNYIDRNPIVNLLENVSRESLGKTIIVVVWDYVNLCYQDISNRLSQALAIRDSGEYPAPPKWSIEAGEAFSEWSIQNLRESSNTGVYYPTGNNIYIQSPRIELIPQLIDSIKLSATVQTESGKHSSQLIDLSWVSQEFGPSPPEFTRRVVLPADGTAHEVCFPMACDAFWVVQDTITSITFSFPGLSNPIQLHSVECYGPGEVVSINSQ